MNELIDKRIPTNDLKKGARVKLRNGWEAIIQDNKRGNIRTAEVFGTYHETGDIYSHHIVGVKIDEDRKSTRLNSSHIPLSRMPSSA